MSQKVARTAFAGGESRGGASMRGRARWAVAHKSVACKGVTRKGVAQGREGNDHTPDAAGSRQQHLSQAALAPAQGARNVRATS